MAPTLDPDVGRALHDGLVIPAHPLALDDGRNLDRRRQRALSRYYLAAGAGGLAVGVHTTQFAIREAGLLAPVLELAAEEASQVKRPTVLVAGICGETKQALDEAELAAGLGYHLGLLSMGGLADWSDDALLERAREVANVLPVFGFYLQPAVGGRALGYDFWLRLADTPGVMAIKIAPFDRYRTLEVVRAVCHSQRCDDIALYTGNDDNIVADLLTPYVIPVGDRRVEKSIVGGLLGHWAVWTHEAVRLLDEVKRLRRGGDGTALRDLLERSVTITDANAAFFDAANDFRGCIAGLHEVLRRQGLLAGTWCLDPEERMSPGQAAEIDRVYRSYPDLNDDAFVTEHLEDWLAGSSGR